MCESWPLFGYVSAFSLSGIARENNDTFQKTSESRYYTAGGTKMAVPSPSPPFLGRIGQRWGQGSTTEIQALGNNIYPHKWNSCIGMWGNISIATWAVLDLD